MHVHHLSCGTFCPFGGRFMDGRSTGLRGRLICHCLLLETDGAGLVLVDTGLGIRDLSQPFPRLSRFNANLLNIQFDPGDSALRQLERLGFTATDVRHIVLTHLDFDHAGGLADFPQAEVHLLAWEADAALHGRHGFIAERRYRPAQWSDPERWHRYLPQGEPWFGFQSVRGLVGLPPEILLVPLVGHTAGHAGVAVRHRDGWLLHAGDAFFHHAEITAGGRGAPKGLLAYERMMQVSAEDRLRNQQRLRVLAQEHTSEVTIVCSHDPNGFARSEPAREACTGGAHRLSSVA
jgi:glyoxylase-like metal-dependent hydrolase (beta-lactamase superfamily II)